MELLSKYKGFFILLVGIIGIVLVNWNNLFEEDTTMAALDYSQSLITTNLDDIGIEDTIIIDIKGEVVYPGYYEVSSQLRIGDIITIAGGVTSDADLTDINQAAKVADEMIIVIPKQENNAPFVIPEDIVKIIVEIKGEVNHPGIYDLSKTARVADLLDLAGGLTDNADLANINQAAKLSDGDIISVPTKVPVNNTEEITKIVVEIKGEVKHPGIYTMYPGSRVTDLITLAGGLTDDSNSEMIELARILVDGESIVIPKKDDIDTEERYIYVEVYGEIIHPGVYYIPEDYSMLDLVYEAGGVTINCDLEKINWDLTLCLGAKLYIPSYEDEDIVIEDGNRININTANLETLMTLPGIGQIIGQRIIDYRAEYGSFLSIEEIMNVSGIKESVYEQIKELIAV